MAQVCRYETRWNQLASRVGERDATLNAALLNAMTAYQQHNGMIPGGYDFEETEDLFELALAGYRKLGQLGAC